MLLKSSGQGCPSKLVVKLQLCCPLVFSDGAMFEVCNGSFLHLELFDTTAHFWKTELFLDFFKV